MVLAVVLAIAAMAVLIYRWQSSGFEWSVFASTLAHLDPGWLSLSVVLCLLTYVGRALRWQVMVRPLKPNPSLWNILSATVIGFTGVVLFGRPGELARPYLIAVREQLSFSSQMATWMLERIYDLLLVLLIFGISLQRVSRHTGQFGPAVEWVLRAGGYIIGFLGLICLGLLFLFNRLSPAGERRIEDALGFLPPAWHARIVRVLTEFLHGMRSTRSLGFIIRLLIYSVLEWALIAASLLCLFRAFPATAHFSVTDVFVFLGFVSFGSAVQIPGIGGGLQVAAIVVLTELFHLSFEVSASLALVVWLLSFVMVTPFGLVLAFHQGIRWRTLRQLEADSPAL